jgi:hypothetical protein
MRLILSTALLLSTVAAAGAQERTIASARLPHAVEARLQSVVDNPATHKITGEATISDKHEGDVVAYNGPLTITGTVLGQLIVLDGNVEFKAGSSVTGDVTLIGGEAIGIELADIGGTVTMYSEGFGPGPLRDYDRRVYSVDKRTGRKYRDDDHWRNWGYSTFTVKTGWNYNRVEGLPVHFGPTIETAGRNPTRFEAHAIWRTEVSSPWDTEDLGYSVRAEQFFGGRRDFRVGASLRSVVDPIESWQMNKVEASLASFVLHQDYRDYFLREGWSGYLQYAPRASGVTAIVEYRDEEHQSQAARDPWTIFDNSESWRLQPLVAEGNIRSINGIVEVDRRDDDDFATSGFFVRGELTRSLDNDLAYPGTVTPPIGVASAIQQQFTTGLIDARVYQRVGYNATLSFRFLGAGALTDSPLPAQFQRALGGAGSLPGYASFSADCGARRTAVTNGSGDFFFPYYGCNRTALFSAEYRGGFDFHWGGLDAWDEEDDWDWDVHASPNWVVFFDAARGWAHEEAKLRGATDTETLYDVGAGILLGDFGLYGAVPLTGDDRSLRFFIRLGARF